MKHLDLFSGIGGFALAAEEMVWNDVEHVFCDNEPFSQAILKKHWPNAHIYGDIRTLTADAGSEESRRVSNSEWEEIPASWQGGVDLLTGGFPCQPFSQAGRRKGTGDDRFLWPEMLRVIREFRPRWVIGENVAGLLSIQQGVVFEQVCADLEGEGYTVQPFVIPAVAVNAPHRRDRVWIVANLNSSRLQRSTETGDARRRRKTSQQRFGKYLGWDKNWLEVATRLCRIHDGIPRRMDRTPRLKALGNAIVPQVAAEIMRAIKASDATPH